MDIGIDMVSIARMRAIVKEEKTQFLTNTFSPLEREYCFLYSDPAPHLAGTFAAKEAVRKASTIRLPFNEIEIRRTKEGKPEVWLQNKRADSLHISITHTDTDACAIAVSDET